ncbi:hypothetical protein V6N13_016888 [Hibiscus sabdariffa]|uniref:Uncharacterized protein n=1 Tax=Hibiscus sabdariffa TaxID=183260 RepID=A0ABR2PUM8_9ROSI
MLAYKEDGGRARFKLRTERFLTSELANYGQNRSADGWVWTMIGEPVDVDGALWERPMSGCQNLVVKGN